MGEREIREKKDITTVEKEYYEEKYKKSSGNIAYIWRVAEKEIFKDYLKDVKGKTLLEVGCGDGTAIAYLTTTLGISKFRYIGIDISQNAIKYARNIFPRGEFLTADITKLPIRSNSTDIVLCFGVLHHLEDPYSGLKEIFRILKPGGIILLREPSDEAFKEGEGESPYEAGLNVNEFMEKVEVYGGKILTFIRINPIVTHPLRYIFEKLNHPIYWELKTKIDIYINKLFGEKLKLTRGLDFLMVVKKIRDNERNVYDAIKS